MRRLLATGLLCLVSGVGYCAGAFELVPLGVYGGSADGNLSSYLLKSVKGENYVALDAGALVNGLEAAVRQEAVHGLSVKALLQAHIPAYFISHAHLDHSMGLLMVQPELREQQNIIARDETIQALENHVFSWAVWGNFGDAGELPHLNLQHYQSMPLMQWMDVPKTDLQVKSFPLSHGGMASTAFLVRNGSDYVLYFGDTGADIIEKSNNIENIWNEVAPLIRNHQLRAIMLECSFTNTQADDKLFGHLKPSLYLTELHQLAMKVDAADPANALRGLTVIVTHVKPSLDSLANADNDTREVILAQLTDGNDLGVKFVLPAQGELITL